MSPVSGNRRGGGAATAGNAIELINFSPAHRNMSNSSTSFHKTLNSSTINHNHQHTHQQHHHQHQQDTDIQGRPDTSTSINIFMPNGT